MNKLKLLLSIIICVHLNDADQSLQCGDWDVYKDEKCIKVFVNKELQKYEDARNTCYQNEGSSLVSIRSEEEQEFLFNLLHVVYKNENGVWIGAHYKDSALKWTDNATVNYTNWANGNPRNDSGFDCVQMTMIEPFRGKWVNEPCNINYLVVCQKAQNWLFSYLQKTVLEMRESFVNLTKQLESTNKELLSTKNEFKSTQTELKSVLENTKSYLENEIRKKSIETTPPGTVAYFSNTTAPYGWLKANGHSVSRVTYANLFATIGTSFGSGDGSTTFTLPDLRSEFIRSWNDGRDVDKNRAFGSFQWGSHIPMSGYINDNPRAAGATAFHARWGFAGNTFDGGHEWDIPCGETRDGITFPNSSDRGSNEMFWVSATTEGFMTKWNVFKGTRPRNIALLACIKY